MRIEVEGWGKNFGQTEIVARPISGTCITDATLPLSHDEVRAVSFDGLDFQNRRKGLPTATEQRLWGDQVVTTGVTIVAGTHQIALNGRYQLTLQLSADELLTLAVEATKNWPVEYLIKRLSNLRDKANSG